MDKPVTPRGVNHLVLNVRDIEESHKFWTEIVGFKQVGQLDRKSTRLNSSHVSESRMPSSA